MADTSARFGISEPTGGPNRTDAADVPLFIRNIVAALESSGTLYGQGAIASRPVSTGGSPGKQGRFYVSTDESPKVVYYDYGTGWITVGFLASGSVGTAQLADDSVTAAKIAAGAVGASEIADGSIGVAELADDVITAAKLVDGIVPSRGAGAGVEALRALGTSAATAAAGNDARFVTVTRSLISGGPPSTPATGDIWIAVDSLANPTYTWNFRYNGASSSAYKWEANGCTPIIVTAAGATPASFTLPRNGDYVGEGKAMWSNGGTTTSATQTATLESPAASAIDISVMDASQGTWRTAGGGNRQQVVVPLYGKRLGATSGDAMRINGADNGSVLRVEPLRVS